MSALAEAIKPADVTAVRTTGLPGELIRFGAALQGKPDLDNHIAIAHHRLPSGIWRGIEARPGGVAWVDMTGYLESPWTVSNVGQPKTELQRAGVCKIMEQMLKTSYDDMAIIQDGLNDLHIPLVWAEDWHGHTPDHVVCSSLAAWGYFRNGLDRPMPSDPAHVQPADWVQFILLNGYQNLPGAV